jgi:hypothetical protein
MQSVVPRVIALARLHITDILVEPTKRGAHLFNSDRRILAFLVEGVVFDIMTAYDKRYLCIQICDEATLALKKVGEELQRNENAKFWSPIATNLFKARLSEKTTFFDRDGNALSTVSPNTRIKCLVRSDRLWRLDIDKVPRFGMTFEVTQVVAVEVVPIKCLIVADA